jgi:hypothetical protein
LIIMMAKEGDVEHIETAHEALAQQGTIHEAGMSAGEAEVLHASCWGYLIHAGCKGHITPQGTGVATGPVKFVVGAPSEKAGLDLAGRRRWKTGPLAHTCASMAGASVGPPVAGRDWSPVSSNKARPWLVLSNSGRPPCPTAAEARSPAGFAHTWCSANTNQAVIWLYVYAWASAGPTARGTPAEAPRPSTPTPPPPRAT